MRLHDLRHTHASILISGGASLALVGKMLGHTQAATTLKYSHFHDRPLQEAADTVARFVEAATNGSTGEVVPLRKQQ